MPKKLCSQSKKRLFPIFQETFVVSESVKELIDIVIKLRSDNGCDWDRKQTSESLTPHLIEEANEVVNAVLEKNSENLKEELGDLLLHVVFQAVIASEKKTFDFEDVVQQINEKLIKRHPHIFDKNYDGEDLSNAKNWELIKKSEKDRESILDGMPKSLSALIVAQRYQDKTGAVGFEWENSSQAMDKVDEELGELKQAINNNDLNNIEEEIGDLLITIVNLARFFDISADLALRKTNQKFYRRFNFIEKIVQKNNQKIEDISLGELLNYWKKAKNEEK
ncbi:nucleoside triphosphate pyrophosphohydrolase [Candidatus Marinimicrobia bacterium]|nr:nucleoside triphosphate pyrophosphohydrolase [Candidatus Neomarinimicrobiota bacterium]